MVEISRDTPETLPPQRWHDVIRANFSGIMSDPDCFESYTQQGKHGLQYSLLSITRNDPSFKGPKGIYLETNIPKELAENARLYLDGVLMKFTMLLCEVKEPVIKTEIPAEIKDKVPEPGAYIDFGNAINLEFFGTTGHNTIVFCLKPIAINEATEKMKQSLGNPGSFNVSRI